MKLEEKDRRRAERDGRVSSSHQPNQPQENQEGYLSYMQRQMADRTQQLGMSGDHMDRLEENSSNWARDVNKYVQNQKRKAVFGGEFSSNVSLSVSYFADHVPCSTGL